jgi:hypothetical protein
MASKSKKAKAVLNATDVAKLAKSNPYLQRLIDDAKLRDNVQKAVGSSKSAYARFNNGKAPRQLLEDKKLQNDLSEALSALRDASLALSEAPKRRVRKGRRLGRRIVVIGLGGGLALVGSEKIRSKVLDTLFGKEEEFQYSPPSTSSPSQATPVSS